MRGAAAVAAEPPPQAEDGRTPAAGGTCSPEVLGRSFAFSFLGLLPLPLRSQNFVAGARSRRAAGGQLLGPGRSPGAVGSAGASDVQGAQGGGRAQVPARAAPRGAPGDTGGGAGGAAGARPGARMTVCVLCVCVRAGGWEAAVSVPGCDRGRVWGRDPAPRDAPGWGAGCGRGAPPSQAGGELGFGLLRPGCVGGTPPDRVLFLR